MVHLSKAHLLNVQARSVQYSSACCVRRPFLPAFSLSNTLVAVYYNAVNLNLLPLLTIFLYKPFTMVSASVYQVYLVFYKYCKFFSHANANYSANKMFWGASVIFPQLFFKNTF